MPAWNQSRIYYINHITTLICTFLENLKKNGQEMKATQKNFQSLLLNDYKSVKMRFDFVYDYPRPFSNTKYQKNGQKKGGGLKGGSPPFRPPQAQKYLAFLSLLVD